MLATRSLLFNALFYLNMIVLMIVGLPTMLFGRKAVFALARLWGAISVWLLEAICGLKLEYRGVENIPPGAVLIAAKHQSFLETFALLKYAPDFAIILKRQLTYVPLFGLYLIVSQQIAIDRGRGRHLPGGNPARPRRAAEIQARRGRSLCRDWRPLPAGRGQYRPVLAPARLPQAPRRGRDRISARNRARA
jgi:1-acyl-sn-glycerol-3-phosphate acyltransferase